MFLTKSKLVQQQQCAFQNVLIFVLTIVPIVLKASVGKYLKCFLLKTFFLKYKLLATLR